MWELVWTPQSFFYCEILNSGLNKNKMWKFLYLNWILDNFQNLGFKYFKFIIFLFNKERRAAFSWTFVHIIPCFNSFSMLILPCIINVKGGLWICLLCLVHIVDQIWLCLMIIINKVENIFCVYWFIYNLSWISLIITY